MGYIFTIPKILCVSLNPKANYSFLFIMNLRIFSLNFKNYFSLAIKINKELKIFKAYLSRVVCCPSLLHVVYL